MDLDDRSWEALGQRYIPGTQLGSGTKTPTPLSSHPQYSLKQLLDRLGVTRTDVCELGGADDVQRQRQKLVSEALRPADTSDGWTRYLDATPIEVRAAALDNVALMTARNEADEALSLAIAWREAIELGETAALISPDRMLTRRVAAELARWNIQSDDSAGRPLDQTAPAILAILAAKLALNGCEPIDLLALLKHPLARLGLPIKNIRAAARALERGVIRGERPRPGTDGLIMAVAACRAAAENAHTPRWKKVHEGDWDVIADLAARLQQALTPLESMAGDRDTVPVEHPVQAHIAVMQAISAAETGGAE